MHLEFNALFSNELHDLEQMVNNLNGPKCDPLSKNPPHMHFPLFQRIPNVKVLTRN